MKVYNKDEQGGGEVLDLNFEVEENAAPQIETTANTQTTPSFDYSKFKEYDPEINETNWSERVKSTYEEARELKKRNSDLELAAASIYDIDNDEVIVRNRSLLQKKDDELVFNSLAYQYTNDGLSAEDAAAKANARIKALKEKDEFFIEDKAREIRENIKAYNAQEINKKKAAIQEAREKAKGSTKADVNIKAKTLEAFDAADSVFGFKLDKSNEKFVEKFDKPVREYIQSGELDKDLNDPQVLLEFAIFKKQRPLIEKNLRQPKKPAAPIPGRTIPTSGPTQGAAAATGEGLKKYPRGYQPPKK